VLSSLQGSAFNFDYTQRVFARDLK